MLLQLRKQKEITNMSNEKVCGHCGWTQLAHERSSSFNLVAGRKFTLSQCKQGLGFVQEEQDTEPEQPLLESENKK